MQCLIMLRRLNFALGSHSPAVAKNVIEFCDSKLICNHCDAHILLINNNIILKLSVPTVTFCSSSYTISNSSIIVTVCICTPFNKTALEVSLLYELKNENYSSFISKY